MNAEEFKNIFKEMSSQNNAILKNQIRDSVKEELNVFKEDLKTEIKQMVDQSLAEANGRITTLEEELAKKDTEIADIKADFQKMKSQTISLDFASRSNNLVLFKVAEKENISSNNSLANGVCKMIKELADPTFVEADIADIYREHLRSSSKRNFLLKQKRKFAEKNVGIAEDLPKEIQDWRKKLYELADHLRKTGKKVLFRQDKMLVDGVELTDEQIKEHQNQCRKRTRSPEEKSDKQANASKRATVKLKLPGTPKTQREMEQYFSPAATSMNKTFHFVSGQ